MTAEEITAEYLAMTVAGVLARGTAELGEFVQIR